MSLRRFVIPALVLGQLAGVLDLATQSVWINSCIQSGSLSLSTIGLVGSLELMLAACFTLTTAAILPRLNLAHIAPLAALTVAGGNAVAALPVDAALITGRLLSGAGVGVLNACVTGIIARRADVLRVQSYATGANFLVGAVINLLLPVFAVAGGATRLFTFMAVIGTIATIGLFIALRHEPLALSFEKATGRPAAAGRVGRAAVVACVAYAVLGIGLGTLGPYVLVIGQGLGFDLQSLGFVIAAGGLIALIGPVIVHRLGERKGLLLPLLAAYIVIALCWIVLVHAPTVWVFGACSAVSSTAYVFSVPYVVAFLGRLDPSGRAASASHAFMTFGASTGPKIGSTVLEFTSFHAVAYVAVGFVAFSMTLFGAAANRKRGVPVAGVPEPGLPP